MANFSQAAQRGAAKASERVPRAQLRLVADESLASQTPASSASSIEELYRAHYTEICRTVGLLGVPAAEREDIAQEVFMVAHRRLSDFEGRSTYRTWLIGITRRVASQYHRSEGRHRRRIFAWASERRPVSYELDGIIENREAAEIVSAFLKTISPEEREAFVLGAVQGLGRVEMSEVLDISPNTAYSRLARARKKFKANVQGIEASRRRGSSTSQDQQFVVARSLPAPLLALLSPRDSLSQFLLAAKQWFLGASATTQFVSTLALGSIPVAVAAQATDKGAPVQSHSEPRAVSGELRSSAPPVFVAAADPLAFELGQSEPELPVPALHTNPPISLATGSTEARRYKPDARISALEQEVRLLKRAQDAASSGQVEEAFLLLNDHATRYPNGRLTIDRQFLYASLICDTSPSRARPSVEDFVGRYPNHPQTQMLLDECALGLRRTRATSRP